MSARFLGEEHGGADLVGPATLNKFGFAFVCEEKKTVVIYRMTWELAQFPMELLPLLPR